VNVECGERFVYFLCMPTLEKMPDTQWLDSCLSLILSSVSTHKSSVYSVLGSRRSHHTDLRFVLTLNCEDLEFTLGEYSGRTQ